MGKHSRKRRYSDEDHSDSDNYIRKKIRKLEKKLCRKRHRSESVSTNDSMKDHSHQEDHYSVTAEEHQSIVDLELIDPYPEVSEPLDTQPAPSTSQTEQSVPTLRSSVSVVQLSAIEPSPQDGTPIPSLHGPSGQSTQPDVQAADTVPELDQDILDLLGETPSKEKAYGEKIQNDLAVRWNHILLSGLTKESRKDIIEKCLIPENCKNMDAPILNPETKAALSDVLVKKDKALENKQKQRAAAISCLGQAFTRLFEIGIKDTGIIKPLLDAAKLTCDLQHTDSLVRRSFICSTLKKEVKDRLYGTEIDKFLFSEKLPDILKASKAIQKSGAEMKVSSYKTKRPASLNRPLNSRPPLPASRPTAGVSRKPEPAPAAMRRRAPPPPPPPPPPAAYPYARQQPRLQNRAPRNR